MKKKIILYIFLSISLIIKSNAQEMPFYKSYFLNNFLLNPAFCGLEEYTPILLIDKHQWFGDEYAPATQLFTISGKLKKEGYAVSIFNDKAGRFSTQSMQLSYSHHITLSKKKHFKRKTGKIIRERPELALGVTFAAYRLNFDQLGITTIDFDPAVSGKMETSNFPDANFGMYYQKKGGFVSLSAQQLISARINLYNRDEENNRLQRQYFLFFGKEFNVDKLLNVEPSMMIKTNESKQFEIEINLKFIYFRDYWFAITYSRDANNLLEQNHLIKMYAGIKIFNSFHAAYAYNHMFNNLQNNTLGTHEFMLRYNLFEEKKGRNFY